MKKVLVVKANDRPAPVAVSTTMFETFMEEARQKEDWDVTVYDVFERDIPYFGQTYFDALERLENKEPLNEKEQSLIDHVNEALDLFLGADLIVFAFPMWNLTVPAPLHAFMDYIYQAGKTFKYTEQGPVGLVTEPTVVLLNARDGVYSIPETEHMDMGINFIRLSMQFFGVTDIREVIIEGHNAMSDRRDEIIATGLDEVRALAREL